MAELGFLHGVEIVSITTALRTVQTVASSVIGLIGTAPDADDEAFPLDVPTLVSSRAGYAAIGAGGTLTGALDAIFDQASPFVVVIRVAPGTGGTSTMSNIIGGVDGTSGVRTGIAAFRDSMTHTGVTPMILIAPTFTSIRPNGLTAVTVSNVGSAYTTAPTVTFTGGGTDTGKVLPTATAVLGTGGNAGKIASVTINTHGANLTQAPTIAFTGGGGQDAAATAVLGAYANPVTDALRAVAVQLRAHCVVAGPNTTDAAAILYRNDFGDRRVFIVDPFVQVLDDSGTYVSEDPAPRIAGLIARIDAEQGFWKSPSNEEIYGIGGLDRPVDWVLGDPNTRANLLNSNEVATIIRDDGWRLWGNRTTSSDPAYAFLAVSRCADMVDLSIQKAHRWACDQVIGRGYFDAVTASVNGYLRQLQARGAILGGKCWVDPDFNTDADLAAGRVTFSYDFTPPTPAERVTFRSSLTSDYVASIFTTAS